MTELSKTEAFYVRTLVRLYEAVEAEDKNTTHTLLDLLGDFNDRLPDEVNSFLIKLKLDRP